MHLVLVWELSFGVGSVCLSEQLPHPADFLVGNDLSIADITVIAFLASTFLFYPNIDREISLHWYYSLIILVVIRLTRRSVIAEAGPRWESFQKPVSTRILCDGSIIFLHSTLHLQMFYSAGHWKACGRGKYGSRIFQFQCCSGVC